MHELDAYKYWSTQGTTGNALLKKAAQVLQAYPKANKQRRMECLALTVSLIKAKCYEDGIKWSVMALSEQSFIGSIGDPPSIVRKPPEPVPPKEEKPAPEEMKKDAKQLAKAHKKDELAKLAAEQQKKLDDLQQQLDDLKEE